MSEKKPSKGTKRRNDGEAIGKYGKDCYRQNSEHFQELSHTDGTTLVRPEKCNELLLTNEQSSMTKESFTTCNKTLDPHSYSFHFNKVEGIEHCFNETCLSLQDILSNFGNLVKSVQFNYLIDIDWLMSQYPSKYRSKPLLIVHGYQNREQVCLREEASRFENIRLCQADLTIPFGTHHTKMMIHLYEEGLRIIVTTANLVESDWTKKTQSIWVSPMFPKRPSGQGCGGSDGTGFHQDLTDYLSAYKKRFLDEWIQIINEHDLSGARVHLVASVPGRFPTSGGVNYGHLKLKRLLQQESRKQEGRLSLVCQASSIGSLGPRPDSWLTGEFLGSLSSCQGGQLPESTDFKIVYPSVENIRNSLEGYMAGGSFPYSAKVASKQTYLKKFMHKWKFDVRGRSQAMPHLKSYFLTSRDEVGDIHWYLMTSANLSKAAWGCYEKNRSQFFIRSYEVGILFLPRLGAMGSTAPAEKNFLSNFSVSVDLPLESYSPDDEPWLYDVSYTDEEDSHGRIWRIR